MIRKKKRILVILGGASKERPVSLETGKACLRAIKKLGINKHHRKTFSPISKIKNHNI